MAVGYDQTASSRLQAIFLVRGRRDIPACASGQGPRCLERLLGAVFVGGLNDFAGEPADVVQSNGASRSQQVEDNGPHTGRVGLGKLLSVSTQSLEGLSALIDAIDLKARGVPCKDCLVDVAGAGDWGWIECEDFADAGASRMVGES